MKKQTPLSPQTSPVSHLFLASAGDMAGSEFSLLLYFQSIDRRRYSPFVLCCQPGSFPQRLQENGIPHVVIPLVLSLRKVFAPASVLQNMKALWKIYRLINDPSFKLVQANDTMVLKVLWLPLLFCRNPVLFHLRNYEWKRLWMVRQLFRKPSRHGAAVSHAVLNHYRDFVGIPERSLRVVHLAINPRVIHSSAKNNILCKELKLDQSTMLIGLVARFDVWKGHLTLLKAFERICSQYPKAHLVIVGEMLNPDTFPFLVEYKAKVLQYASRPDLARRVHFLGWRDDVSAIYRSLDIVVCPSEREPFARVVLEAMASGVPLVGADSGGVPEIITHELNGLLFRTGNHTDLAECLNRLLADKKLGKRLATEGKKTISKYFTMQTYMHNIEQLYSRILD